MQKILDSKLAGTLDAGAGCLEVFEQYSFRSPFDAIPGFSFFARLADGPVGTLDAGASCLEIL